MSNEQSGQLQPVTVPLGDRRYEVRFYNGDLPSLARDLKPFVPERALIVTNETIWAQHGAALSTALAAQVIDPVIEFIGDGERFKTLEQTRKVYDRLIADRYSRKACVIAFGGGVVGDLAGFVAATFLRGVNFIQIPTTVVAMVDSSVGGKTGVDHPLGKNLIGAFHQPRLVAVDSSFLSTLDDFNLRGGFAEVIKYGVIYDAEFFEFLEREIDGGIALKPEIIGRIIRRSCEIKAEVVGQDEHEGGLRAILNYGHTFGHAIEALGEYRERQFHGQAVAIGMCCAADLAVSKGLLDAESAARIEALIGRAGLPTRVPADATAEEIWDRMHSDKKVEAGTVRFILPTVIGKVEMRKDVTKDEVLRVLANRR